MIWVLHLAAIAVFPFALFVTIPAHMILARLPRGAGK